jgi:2-amino-4-hydroxy-6-hydroxymethyldihydropteridine diphosphokinase
LLKNAENNNLYLGLGSNIGNREYNLKKAVEKIADIDQTKIIKISSIYSSRPVGYTEQDDFLNMVIHVLTAKTPQEFLHETQAIEKELGRKKTIHWGPRIIDIDILLYNNLKIIEKNLIIPHERLYERAFVLIPLQEIYSGNENLDFKGLIDKTEDRKGVTLFKGV